MFGHNKDFFLNREYTDPLWKITDLSGNSLSEDQIPFNIVKKTLKGLLDHRIMVEGSGGKKGYVSINYAPLFDAKGGFNGMVCNITDISQLNESEEKFKSIAEQSIFGILILQDGRYKYINQTFADMTRYTVEEMMKWGPLEFLNTIHPEDRQRVAEHVKSRQEATDKGYHRYQFRGFKKTGELLYSEIWSKPILFEGRNATFITVADITDKKETEEKYFNAFNRAEFFKDLFAHDINNILQSIKSANEILGIIKDSEDFPRKFEKIHQLIDDQVDRGAQLVANIRKLSRIEEEGARIAPVNLCGVLKDAISTIKQSFINKRINIKTESPVNKIQVLANEFLTDVVYNILNNAVKYNHHEIVEITVSVEKLMENGKPFVKLQFTDNGIGIPDNRKCLIFSRDYHKNHTSIKGMGVGLSLVKKVIESYRGEISVDDRVKADFTKGSVFSILIPEATPEHD